MMVRDPQSRVGETENTGECACTPPSVAVFLSGAAER